MKLKDNWPQCVCIVLGTALAILMVLAFTGHATEQTWTYKRALGGTADSVIYNVWHGWDSVGTVTDTTNRDSLMFSFTNVQDTTNNWVDAFIFWNGYDSADGDRIFMGNSWVAKETNVYYQIRHRWADPPDTVIRTIRQNYVLVETKIMVGPVYRDCDSILTGIFTLNDTDVVTVITTECWGGGERTAFEEIVPTATNEATLEIIYDTVSDTIHTPAEPVSASICRVYGYIGELGGEWVHHASVNAVLDERVSIDTCTNILIFDRRKSTRTDVNGYFSLDLVRSKCLTDLKYTLTVHKAGLEDVVRKITIPDSATYRISWE